MTSRALSKAEVREAAWSRLADSGEARFPYPPTGRIPNFAGAAAAAERLFDVPWIAQARHLKVNPDAPQRPFRLAALRRGISVLMPTPRLKGGFLLLDPRRIPEESLREAASLSRCERWARRVSLEDLPPIDAIVCGSVAVTRDGRRAGKGHGYSDLEAAILRELGHGNVPVASTVHALQVVEEIPADPHDLIVSAVATPDELVLLDGPPRELPRLDWSLLGDEDLAAMPVLAELRRRADPS